MDATYRVMAAARELGEFTVAMLAAQADVKPVTVRTVLNRHRQLFEQDSPGSGRRGGQPRVWRVKDTARDGLDAIISGIGDRFGEDQNRLLLGNTELATAEHLAGFARHLDARELLPHIVRRLLVATPGFTTRARAAGDGIGLHGFHCSGCASAATP